jgi:hypothetical protein
MIIKETKEIIELIMAGSIPVVLGLVFTRSIISMNKASNNSTNEKLNSGGIGARIIQFTTIALLIPCLIILGLEKIIQGETIATIVGGLIGYVLSGISNYDKEKK